MWAAFGVRIPDQLSLKHTLPVAVFSVIFAEPLPSGSPFGDSALPDIDVVRVLVAANAETAMKSAAISASENRPSVFMGAILPRRVSADQSDKGPNTLSGSRR